MSEMNADPDRTAVDVLHWVRLIVRVGDCSLSKEPPAELLYPTADGIRIQFRHPLEGEFEAQDGSDDPADYPCVGVAAMQTRIPRKLLAAFVDGRIRLIRYPEHDSWEVHQDVKESAEQFYLSVVPRLLDALGAVYRVLRWKQSLPGRANPFFGDRLEWSADGSTWCGFPDNMRPALADFNFATLTFGDADVSQARSYVERGTREPVAHELWREAWLLCAAEDLRSALVIGMSAAEIGVKEFIAKRVPEVELLVTEMQSPDLLKLLSYVRRLLPEDAKYAYSVEKKAGEYVDPVMRRLQAGVTLRNIVVHRPVAEPPKLGDVSDTLRKVRHLLYLLDFHAGHTWAEKWIKPREASRLLDALRAKPQA